LNLHANTEGADLGRWTDQWAGGWRTLGGWHEIRVAHPLRFLQRVGFPISEPDGILKLSFVL